MEASYLQWETAKYNDRHMIVQIPTLLVLDDQLNAAYNVPSNFTHCCSVSL